MADIVRTERSRLLLIRFQARNNEVGHLIKCRARLIGALGNQLRMHQPKSQVFPRYLRCRSSDVRFGSKADARPLDWDVRYNPKNAHGSERVECPLRANKRHPILSIRYALPVESLDLVEGAAWFVEKQHESQPVGQIWSPVRFTRG